MPNRPAVHGQTERKKRVEQQRGSAWARGYDRTWQRVRLMHLRANPLCVRCHTEGRVVPATDVDHIVPHRGNRELFTDHANLQSLCASCHSQKTARGE